MVHLNTTNQLFCVNINQEKKFSFRVTMKKITDLVKNLICLLQHCNIFYFVPQCMFSHVLHDQVFNFLTSKSSKYHFNRTQSYLKL